MLYQTFAPPPQLAPYVRFFWALEDEADGEFIHRSIADCCVEMVFHYRGVFDEIDRNGITAASPLANIQAQSTLYRRYVTRQTFGIFGVYMYPVALPHLFSVPASELTNVSPDLVSAFGRDGRLLQERMLEAADNLTRVAVASEFLLSKLSSQKHGLPHIHHAALSILRSNGTASVSELAQTHGLSRRQFERKFKEFAGLSPKLYSRIARFQAATQFKFAGCRDLAEIAYSCGYYDQSHFSNEFREFSGYTPAQYFLNEAEGTQYINSEEMSHFSNTPGG
ncbi:MAG: helix-turn-helix transcriptional regulator [Acidobacteria bacterium]|nr:helix-turn-helix transcriptional regulator [Acidobacteriota bacterium]